jgi:hypothetical protein
MKRRKKPRTAQVARGQVTARRVLAQRLEGYSFPAIGERLGLSTSATHEAYQRGLAEICSVESIHEVRRRALARLEYLRTKVYARLAQRFSVALIDCALRIEMREAALTGSDAAEKFDVTATVEQPSREALAESIRVNLDIDEQRMLVRLLMKARGEEPPRGFVGSPPPPVAPTMPPSPPNVEAHGARGYVEQPLESPGSFEQWCAQRQLAQSDPVAKEVWQRECDQFRRRTLLN